MGTQIIIKYKWYTINYLIRIYDSITIRYLEPLEYESDIQLAYSTYIRNQASTVGRGHTPISFRLISREKDFGSELR